MNRTGFQIKTFWDLRCASRGRLNLQFTIDDLGFGVENWVRFNDKLYLGDTKWKWN